MSKKQSRKELKRIQRQTQKNIQKEISRERKAIARQRETTFKETNKGLTELGLKTFETRKEYERYITNTYTPSHLHTGVRSSEDAKSSLLDEIAENVKIRQSLKKDVDTMKSKKEELDKIQIRDTDSADVINAKTNRRNQLYLDLDNLLQNATAKTKYLASDINKAEYEDALTNTSPVQLVQQSVGGRVQTVVKPYQPNTDVIDRRTQMFIEKSADTVQDEITKSGHGNMIYGIPSAQVNQEYLKAIINMPVSYMSKDGKKHDGVLGDVLDPNITDKQLWDILYDVNGSSANMFQGDSDFDESMLRSYLKNNSNFNKVSNNIKPDIVAIM